MTTLLLEESRSIVRAEQRYRVDAFVLYKVQFNNPGHHPPDVKILARVIDCFLNGGRYTYRLVLESRWNGTVPGYGTKEIVVGNVSERDLSFPGD